MVDTYKIAVSLVLQNGVSAGLAVISRDILGLKAPIGEVKKGFESWKPAVLAAAGALLGGEMLRGLAAVAKAGGDVNHQLELMKIAGMSNADIQKAMAQAMQTSHSVLTTTYAENLKHIRELRYAFGNSDVAMSNMDMISKSNSVLNTVKGGGKDQVWELVKSLEQKGLTFNPQEFADYVNTMTKVVEATGGKVTPQQFMSAFKYGRTATLGWDEGFVGGALPRLIQSMAGGGGSGVGGPGNALMSAFAKVVQGQMPKKAAEEFERMGLAHEIPIEGSSKSKLGDVVGRDLFLKNPYEWVQQVLMPSLKAHGITSDQDIIAEISKLMPVRTASQVISEMALQGRFHEGANSPFEKDIALQKGAMGLNQSYEELIKNDYPTILRAFNQQWTNLLQTLGAPAMAPGGPVISALAAVTAAMGKLGTIVAGMDPETMTNIFKGVAAGAVALMAAGTVGLLAMIGPAGWLVGGIAALAALSLDPGFRKWLQSDTISQWFNRNLIDPIKTWLASDSIAKAFSGLGDAILNAIKSELAGIFSKLKDFGGDVVKHGNDLLGGQGNPAIIPNSWHPGTRPMKAQPITLNLNVDGRTLGQAVSEQLTRMYGYPTGAPVGNDSAMWANGDAYGDDI